MLSNTLSKTTIDDLTAKDYTKVVQSASGSIFKRGNLPFGTVEELKISSQVTKRGRSETLVDLTTSVISNPATDVATEDYVRVFIKFDKPELSSDVQITALTEMIDMLSKITADDALIAQLLNGES